MSRLLLTALVFIAVASAGLPVLAEEAPAPRWELGRLNGDTFLLVRDGRPVAKAYLSTWGPGYKWLGGKVEASTKAGASLGVKRFDSKDGGATVDVAWRIARERDAVAFEWDATVAADRDVQASAWVIEPAGQTNVRLVAQAGRAVDLGATIGRGKEAGVTRLEIVYPNKETVTFSFTDGVTVWYDGQLRVLLSDKAKLEPGRHYRVAGTLSTPAPATFYAEPGALPTEDLGDWFAWKPANDVGDSVIGMRHWMTTPAAPLAVAGNAFTASGKLMKLWGIQNEYRDCAPEAEEARHRAAWYAKYGCNVVRLFCLAGRSWRGLGTPKGPLGYDPPAMARMDYYVDQLRKQDLYYAVTTIWHLEITEAERDRVLAFDELKKGGAFRTLNGAIWWDKGAQDMQIEMITGWLKRKNPHTGAVYAADPHLAYVDLHNEDNIFWFTNGAFLGAAPTYRKHAAKRFSAWLRVKYGDHAGLVKAWGAAALNIIPECIKDENLDAGTVTPAGNPWYWDNWRKGHPARPRLLDTARFLFEVQQDFHKRAEAAVRATGYRGPFMGSNWQAGQDLPHLLNLYSDASLGPVDRHNYTGGVGSWAIGEGQRIHNASGLDTPGQGLISIGLNQLEQRPFVLSEWCHIPPADWAAAEGVLVAAYGMGLQGWDAGIQHAANTSGFTENLFFRGPKVHNVLSPMYMGIYPALARMVLRGDVAEGPIVARRPATLDQVLTDAVPFREASGGGHDVKEYGSDFAPPASLAVGRAVIDFPDEPAEPLAPKMESYRKGDTLLAATGQLRWTAPGARQTGWIAVDTPGTQGLAGWAPPREHAFADVRITPAGKHAVVLVTALSPTGKLSTDGALLVLAASRARNTGMSIWADHVAARGKGPVLCEPVKATITVPGRRIERVNVLDQDGRRTGRTLPVADGSFRIDTGRDKTLYYEIVCGG
jgi:hypothetical protein